MSDDQTLHKNQPNSQADSDQINYSKNQEGNPSSSLAQNSSVQNLISGPQKEHAPLEAPVVDYIKPTEVEPVLHPEVKEVGVEISHDQEKPKLTEEHQRLGIEYAKESVPVSLSKTSGTNLPYNPEQIAMLKKTTHKDDSKHWLVILTEYLLKKLSFNSNQMRNQERRE
ncbi:MAG: hypothetical protein KatS3mg089_0037 [Patescibacteria group bacterium]|nr:MAG: hypothetical protein KatS3mg089_0037 [Patescibacteria group bacterium]